MESIIIYLNQKLAKTVTKTIQTYYLGGFSPITIKRIIENNS